MQWTDSYSENVLCYTNNIPQKDGGTHLAGFRGSLTRVLKSFIKKENAKKTPTDLLGEDVREGLMATEMCLCIIVTRAYERHLQSRIYKMKSVHKEPVPNRTA